MSPWGAMPPLLPRNPMAAGLAAYGLWRKLTPAQRRLLLDAARAHGPKVAAAAGTHGPKLRPAAAAVATARRKR